VLAVKCDVGNPEDVAATVAEGWKHFGRIDILVNNAGVVAEATIVPEKIPHELFEQTMRVNVLGTWYCCREVTARQLADGKGGSIVNIASIAGMAASRISRPPTRRRRRRSSTSRATWRAAGRGAGFA
jgi:NAD(P)-dependent dehydrogenase (short-subunit alcohol dehydrogenase family)